MEYKVKIIGEAGVNHNGDESVAMELIDTAKQCDVDVIKFQLFSSTKLVTYSAPKARYQNSLGSEEPSQYEMLKKLELSSASHSRLRTYCDEVGIDYLSTAFDEDNLMFLVKELGVRFLKIPSGDLTNAPLLLQHALLCEEYSIEKMYVSTGMATLADVERALGVIAFGFVAGKNTVPSQSAFYEAYWSDEGQAYLRDKVCLLHCTTEYPSPINEVNLRAMNTMQDAFDLQVGFSDHTEDDIASIGAIARGAKVIEKHFTLDRNMEGPDHAASLDAIQLKQFVKSLRMIELALGNSIKGPTKSEIGNITAARRSIVANGIIQLGEKYSRGNIALKRPGNGISPFEYWNVVGKNSNKEYTDGDLILPSD
ncbi:N-acetylneuraminate synthase [Granulosicoccus antarcticus]|uniref:N,N'-diacetyllegionaminic acid synthase n=1 Tax=Granulosicoccus antarcticus IMCC3135 TaxID=1192854 RepID=A0A2Z2P256_9GAMM|nr:N-acetylneuraminate synthase [Granulosicoccus antarcticus]ASJ74607.1 N,N'-diacetyllegionaminic acid synthase [Granulosicoccus antarcticus IMCC3135]